MTFIRGRIVAGALVECTRCNASKRKSKVTTSKIVERGAGERPIVAGDAKKKKKFLDVSRVNFEDCITVVADSPQSYRT